MPLQQAPCYRLKFLLFSSTSWQFFPPLNIAEGLLKRVKSIERGPVCKKKGTRSTGYQVAPSSWSWGSENLPPHDQEKEPLGTQYCKSPSLQKKIRLMGIFFLPRIRKKRGLLPLTAAFSIKSSKRVMGKSQFPRIQLNVITGELQLTAKNLTRPTRGGNPHHFL